jgi:hypothetical protein
VDEDYITSCCQAPFALALVMLELAVGERSRTVMGARDKPRESQVDLATAR